VHAALAGEAVGGESELIRIEWVREGGKQVREKRLFGRSASNHRLP
jgi:hypothetical protein